MAKYPPEFSGTLALVLIVFGSLNERNANEVVKSRLIIDLFGARVVNAPSLLMPSPFQTPVDSTSTFRG
jgi:hypothetical protein